MWQGELYAHVCTRLVASQVFLAWWLIVVFISRSPSPSSCCISIRQLTIHTSFKPGHKSPRAEEDQHTWMMYSDLECGVCYRIFNAGRRCPRELRCRHSFCESCLLALSRPPADRSIVCPLCRHATSIPEDGRLRAELRVDEGVLERLLAAGLLDRAEDKTEEGEEVTLPESPAEDSDSLAASRGGRLRRSWKKVWRKISGKNSPQSSDESMTTGGGRYQTF